MHNSFRLIGTDWVDFDTLLTSVCSQKTGVVRFWQTAVDSEENHLKNLFL